MIVLTKESGTQKINTQHRHEYGAWTADEHSKVMCGALCQGRSTCGRNYRAMLRHWRASRRPQTFPTTRKYKTRIPSQTIVSTFLINCNQSDALSSFFLCPCCAESIREVRSCSRSIRHSVKWKSDVALGPLEAGLQDRSRSVILSLF